MGGVRPGLGATCLRVPPPAARNARLRAGGDGPRRGSGSRASAAERQVGGGAPGAAALSGGFAGGCGRPLSLDGRAHRPGVLPGGPLEARGLRGGGFAPPGAVGVADPALRGFLQMGLRGRGARTGLARVALFLRAGLALGLLRQNHGFGFVLFFFNLFICHNLVGRCERFRGWGEAEKMQTFCVAFFIDSLYTGFFFFFLHLQNIFILEK